MAWGCAQRVEVRYSLPAAAPVGANVSRLRLVSLNAPPSSGNLPDVFSRVEAECSSQSAAPAEVTARVWTEVTDDTQSRRLSVRGQWRDVPALVRVVAMRAEFDVAGGGARATIELRRQWKSTGDPRVRGPKGLERPDDPARVPAVNLVSEELFGQCVKELCAMVAPVEMTATVTRRVEWGNGPDSANVRFNEALELERRAAAGDGDLKFVLESYRRLLDRNKEDDDIRIAVQRVEHALAVTAAARNK